MRKLKVLFVEVSTRDVDINRALEEQSVIQISFIYTDDVSDYDFEGIDCIVYGYRLFKDKELMSMLPAHIPRVIWTGTPRIFEESKDVIVYKHQELSSITCLASNEEYNLEYDNLGALQAVSLTNSIISVCKRKSKVRKFEKSSQPYLQPTISVCERNNKFIGKYFEDVLDYVLTTYLKWKEEKIVNKVSDNRYIISMLDETDRILFQQNIESLKLHGNPMYPDDYRENWYCTVTYYPDNDKIIIKEVFQNILDRHIPNPSIEPLSPNPYIKDRSYYKRSCYKTVITKQGILNCHNKNFRKMGYYSYGNSFLGTAITSYMNNPGLVFNRILKDINLSYRPDIEWTYAPKIYQEIANSINPLHLAKRLNKMYSPDVTKEMIDALVEEHRIEEERKRQEAWEKYHKSVDVDDLPF